MSNPNVATLKAGSFLGEMSFLGHHKISCNVTASGEVELVQVNLQFLNSVLTSGSNNFLTPRCTT